MNEAVVGANAAQAVAYIDENNAAVVGASQRGNVAIAGIAQGPKGSDGTGDRNFVFSQGTPSASWVIVHGFGKYPSVSVIDSAGTEIEGDVHYDSLNQVTVSFNAAFSGSATLN